jgi:hypothetical protein
MHRYIRTMLLPLLLLLTTQAYADRHFVVSPSVGNASISNIKGYSDANFIRLDGSYYPQPLIGLNVFATQYQDFNSNGNGNAVAIKVTGYGVGVVGKWPLDEHFQPYVRADYMLWNAEASALGRNPLASDKGGSLGLALGAQFPIKSRFGIKVEVSGYNKVSDANLRQFSLGLTVEF